MNLAPNQTPTCFACGAPATGERLTHDTREGVGSFAVTGAVPACTQHDEAAQAAFEVNVARRVTKLAQREALNELREVGDMLNRLLCRARGDEKLPLSPTVLEATRQAQQATFVAQRALEDDLYS